jgi:hypothetical protein
LFKELHGVNNLSLTKSTSYADQYLLGGLTSSISVNQPEQLELSIDRSFIGIDDIFNFTGANPITKINIIYGDGKYSLRDLYLNLYSIGFSVGELPKINTKFTSYGGELFYPEDELENTNQNFIHDLPKLGSIFIKESGIPYIVSNNIFSFDYSVEMNRQPYFSIGKKIADVTSILPLKINLSINSKLTKGQLSSNVGFSKITDQNYNFNISVSGSGYLMNFPITNSRLISSEVVVSSDNTAEIKTQFLGYYE